MTPQEIQQIIDMLVEKLGPIGGQVWSIYVRQVYVSIIPWLMFSLVLFMAGTALVVWAKRILGKTKDMGSYKADDARFCAYFMVGGGLFAILLAICCATDITKLLNPEYYAIQMLLGR